MKNLQLITIILALGAATIWSGCNGNDDPDGEGTIEILANIDDPSTWETGNVYLIKKWDFYVNNSLTIQPGVIVKFHPTLGPDLTLGGAGTIIATGTQTDPIVFTSFKDDVQGGDTNEDGDASTPASKDWGAINLNGLNGSTFKYCQFYYGGSSAYSSTLSLNSGSSASVDNCTFAYNDGGDASGWYGTLDAGGAGTGTTITNNIFFNNVRPLSINLNFDLNNSNTFHNPDQLSLTNFYNGIFVDTGDELSTQLNWSETEVAYVIDDNDWWIESSGLLSLADHVVLKFRPGSGMVLANGASSIGNFNGNEVFFTSYKDDNKKGDTNGDGTATTAANGDWGGIYDNSLSIPSPYFYTWTNILYDSY